MVEAGIWPVMVVKVSTIFPWRARVPLNYKEMLPLLSHDALS